MRLQNKVALITGAGSGIGKASAQLFSKEGANVVLVDVNEEAVFATRDEIGADKTHVVIADSSKSKDCEQMIQEAEKHFGQLNILFNNAGIMHLL